MAKLELTSSFVLENEIIDNDHRRLIEIANDIVKALDDDKPELCPPLVADFVDFAKKHFAREEEFLTKVGYPDVEEISGHHLGLNDKMDSMLALCETVGESKLACDSLRRELVYFLMDDVINEDLEFKSFLAEKGLIAKD